MGCSGCKKKTYKEYSKQIDNRTTIGVLGLILVFGFAICGLVSLILYFI